MKRAVLAFAFALALAACNDSDLSNSSIPPIAGIVGGPDQPDGNGNVAMELTTTNVETGSEITVKNIDRDGVEPVHVVAGEAITYALIRADVGDRLSVAWSPEGTEAVEETLFEVRSPRITRLFGHPGEGQVAIPGEVRLEGFGFCHAETCNRVRIDSVLVEPEVAHEPRPGELIYFLGTNLGLTPGSHKIQIGVAAGASGEQYLSNEFTFDVVP